MLLLLMIPVTFSRQAVGGVAKASRIQQYGAGVSSYFTRVDLKVFFLFFSCALLLLLYV